MPPPITYRSVRCLAPVPINSQCIGQARNGRGGIQISNSNRQIIDRVSAEQDYEYSSPEGEGAALPRRPTSRDIPARPQRLFGQIYCPIQHAGVRRAVEKEFPICYDDMDTEELSQLAWCKKGCGMSMHKREKKEIGVRSDCMVRIRFKRKTTVLGVDN
ncbi:hypothetical protein BCR34DRAFT_586139 [Clohesyomyces aquaticus]|uniref:Uncharacterized protein n=1 Tax=Clohesyomyces aquaticus TaxID=1231657 RepID=A0A1Y1ZUI8_9PLEO|nr:hypothetical protein BCR34DRAFT_586139 [Clohesyomyces aquaticus]